MKKQITVVFLACIVLNVWSVCAAPADDGRPDSSALNANKDTVVEGLILQVSKLPDPQHSNYPDCYYTAEFRGIRIKSGEAIPRHIQINILGFKNYKLLTPIKNHGFYRISIVPMEQLSETTRAIQLSDDLNLYDCSPYMVNEITPIANLSKATDNTPKIEFLEDTRLVGSVFTTPLNPPPSEDIRQAQTVAIAKDLAACEQQLNHELLGHEDEWNGKFSIRWQSLQNEFPLEYSCIPENESNFPTWREWNGSKDKIWFRRGIGFWSLPREWTFLDSRNLEISPTDIARLKELRDYLAFHGIQFMVMIVPNNFDIAARQIAPEFNRIPDYRSLFQGRQLLSNGIEAIVTSPAILDSAEGHELMFMYPFNPHPCDSVQKINATLLAKRMERYHLPRQKPLTDFRISSRPSLIYQANDYWPMNGDVKPHRNGDTRTYLYCQGPQIPQSSIVVIGNSFLQTPHGKSFGNWLYYLTGIRPFTVCFSAMGVKTFGIVELVRNTQKLKNVKLVVLYIGTEFFNGSRFAAKRTAFDFESVKTITELFR